MIFYEIMMMKNKVMMIMAHARMEVIKIPVIMIIMIAVIPVIMMMIMILLWL